MKTLLAAFAFVSFAGAAPPGKDLRLTYRSAIDHTDQPYRIYVPSNYDGRRAWPLLLVLHGTSGNQNTLFDDERQGKGHMQLVAEKYGVLLVSPFGRGVTEYRGIGENDLFCVLEDMKKRFQVDEDRIYISGHSMGGTGAAYQAMHHPDVYAAAVAFAPAYSFPWLAGNARLVPIWWIMAADDSDFYHMGINPGIERMRALGAPVEYLNMPGEQHAGPLKKFEAAVQWMLTHRRRAHPKQYEFIVDTPLHGRVWWTSVNRIEKPGRIAVVKAEAEGNNRVRFTLTNVADLSFIPDPKIFRQGRRLAVVVDGNTVFDGRIPILRELKIASGRASVQPISPFSRTSFRTHPVGNAAESLDAKSASAPLANWIADAMRHATGADLALYNRRHYRGLPLPAGTVDVVDLIQASRPFDQYLVQVSLSGREIAEIIEANAAEADRMVFLSGARPIDLVADRKYNVALEGQVVERETMYLAGKFKKIPFRVTDVPFTLALYGYAARQKNIGR